ncbi:MAG: hypothetical protein NTV80_05035 [Verrucomicrobia bacterium]|nr:hypothetical protein [Verrucomicrobiota bacterium]
MKSRPLFFSASLIFLPLLLQAQTYQQPIYSDAELARGAYPGMTQQVPVSQQEVAHHMQCLRNTTQVLQQSFAEHCRVRKYPANSPELVVSAALTELLADVTHFSNDLASKCGKAGRVPLSHIYRTFHILEYSSGEAQSAAAQAGYTRSLAAYFSDINQHISFFGAAGFRNPGIRPSLAAVNYGSRSPSAQDLQLILPPVPGSVISYPPNVPVTQPRRKDDDHNKLDIGDVLGRLLGKKLRGE